MHGPGRLEVSDHDSGVVMVVQETEYLLGTKTQSPLSFRHPSQVYRL